MSMLVFFFYEYRARRDLHSFPTRRSSDLLQAQVRGVRGAGQHQRGVDLVADHPGAVALHHVAQLQQLRDVVERSEEHTSELQSPDHLVCRLLLEKKKQTLSHNITNA